MINLKKQYIIYIIKKKIHLNNFNNYNMSTKNAVVLIYHPLLTFPKV